MHPHQNAAMPPEALAFVIAPGAKGSKTVLRTMCRVRKHVKVIGAIA
jgi:hypothetical protein